MFGHPISLSKTIIWNGILRVNNTLTTVSTREGYPFRPHVWNWL